MAKQEVLVAKSVHPKADGIFGETVFLVVEAGRRRRAIVTAHGITARRDYFEISFAVHGYSRVTRGNRPVKNASFAVASSKKFTVASQRYFDIPT